MCLVQKRCCVTKPYLTLKRGACQSEEMLEEDAARFDTFLKENDERVQAALRKADMEARAKQDKVRSSLCQNLWRGLRP